MKGTWKINRKAIQDKIVLAITGNVYTGAFPYGTAGIPDSIWDSGMANIWNAVSRIVDENVDLLLLDKPKPQL